MEVQKNETLNVQQSEGLTGQANNQAQEVVENIVSEAVNQPTAEEQKENERREDTERKQKERLEMCLEIIRRSGGYVTRSVLAENLAETANIDRTTASKYITAQVKDGVLFEAHKIISDKQETIIPF